MTSPTIAKPILDPLLVLNPAVRVLWRGPDCAQLELGNRSVIVDGLQPELVRRLLTEGVTSPPEGVDDAAYVALHEHGYLTVRTDPHPLAAPRLAGDLAALRVRFAHRADHVLQSRRSTSVSVHGTGRLTIAIATLLAGAGIGRVTLTDSGDVRLSDSGPGGLTAADEGRRFREAAAEAVWRYAHDVDVAPLPPGVLPDLAVIATERPVEPELRDRLHEGNIAHLTAQVGGDHVVVGPLVIPGLTSCLRCADLHRLDRDAAWSALAVQLSTPPRHAAPNDVGLTTLAASMTALNALAYLDGDEPATLDATLELHLPDWRLRRRSWLVHDRCGCGP